MVLGPIVCQTCGFSCALYLLEFENIAFVPIARSMHGYLSELADSSAIEMVIHGP